MLFRVTKCEHCTYSCLYDPSEHPALATLRHPLRATIRSETRSPTLLGLWIDYVWKTYAAFRAGGDYVRTYLFDQHQSNLRVTIGVDFRFGSI